MFDMTEDKKNIFRKLGEKIHTYLRHHFRDNPSYRALTPYYRASILLEDQVLIDSRGHYFWEKVISEDEALVAIQVLENLIKYEDPITETDIENEFRKFGDDYLWIIENWFSEPKFKDNLKLFNQRKDDVKSMSLDGFIFVHYRNAFSRFFNDMLKTGRVSVRKIIEILHPYVDVSELVNLGINDDHIGPYVPVFTEILRRLGNPVHF